jgi:hypothetical protein
MYGVRTLVVGSYERAEEPTVSQSQMLRYTSPIYPPKLMSDTHGVATVIKRVLSYSVTDANAGNIQV